MSGTLYIVATPIGNLEDLTPRARQTLADVDLIAAEDTRHTGRLLRSIGVKTAQKAVHDHNESAVVESLIELLRSGQNIALVSDAGTPLVSDPGYRLVSAAHEHGIPVSPIPGASALTAALSVAGLPTDRFAFEGFLPSKSSARRSTLRLLAAEPRTLVFYESVHRISDTLSDLAGIFGEHRRAFVGRELSKLHEQCVLATIGELRAQVESGRIREKGEFVIVVAGQAAEANESADVDRLISELAGELPDKRVAAIVSRLSGERKNRVYARLLELKKE